MTHASKSKKPRISRREKQHTKERTQAVGELKNSLATTAQAMGYTAELLASDVVTGARKTTDSVKGKAVDVKKRAAKNSGKSGGRSRAKPIVGAVMATAAGAGILMALLKRREDDDREADSVTAEDDSVTA